MERIIEIKATFNGADGSSGYAKGSEYLLRLTTYENGNIMIVPIDPRANHCPYRNVVTFLKNWTNIIPQHN